MKLHLLATVIIKLMSDCLFSFSSFQSPFPKAYRTDYDNATKWIYISLYVKGRTDKKLHKGMSEKDRREMCCYYCKLQYQNGKKDL
jgi:hypothetical protein